MPGLFKNACFFTFNNLWIWDVWSSIWWSISCIWKTTGARPDGSQWSYGGSQGQVRPLLLRGQGQGQQRARRAIKRLMHHCCPPFIFCLFCVSPSRLPQAWQGESPSWPRGPWSGPHTTSSHPPAWPAPTMSEMWVARDVTQALTICLLRMQLSTDWRGLALSIMSSMKSTSRLSKSIVPIDSANLVCSSSTSYSRAHISLLRED